MRTSRTPAPRTSLPRSTRPRATRLRGLVAALLAVPLALGALAATALPASAETEGRGTVAFGAPLIAGEEVAATFTCSVDLPHPGGLVSYSIVGPGSPLSDIHQGTTAPDEMSYSISRTLVFTAPGTYTLTIGCHDSTSVSEARTIEVGAPAPVAEATTTSISFLPSTVEPGNSVDVEAYVSTTDGHATEGTVTFTPGDVVTSVNESGIATASLPNPGPGTHAITATYSGTELFNGSAGTDDVFVKADPVVTSVVPAFVIAPHTVLKAAVETAPGFAVATGTITFQHGDSTVLDTVPLVDGAAELPLPDLATGSYTHVTAVYSGDKSYGKGHSQSSTMTVEPPYVPTKAPALVTVDVPPTITGSKVALKVTVGPGENWTFARSMDVPTPSGSVSVTLTKGGPVQTAPLVDGVASLVFDGVTPGKYTVDAVYSGDKHFEVASGSATTTVVAPVTPPVVAPPVVKPDLTGSTSSLPAGGDITLVARGFLPGELVDFWLHSDPVFLGTATADADGVATLVVAIPAGAPAGEHHVRATGKTSLRTAEIPVTITAAAPVATVPAAAPAAPAPAPAAAPAATPLAATGAELGSTALLVTVLLGSGAVLLAGRRRLGTAAR